MQDMQQPSTANIAIACAIIAGSLGYFIGQGKSLGLFGGSPISAPPQRKRSASYEDSSDEDESAPSEFPDHLEECKLVLVVRTDLGMTKGKPASRITVVWLN